MVDEVEVFDVSDIFERTVKTGLEAFVVALPAVLVFSDVEALIAVAGAAGLAAATAAVALVVNVVLQYARSKSSRVQL